MSKHHHGKLAWRGCHQNPADFGAGEHTYLVWLRYLNYWRRQTPHPRRSYHA
ncbi:Uncharacterised protein [Vibrio cholerae]|nr:Uncharacterised protein [Vibrio cholerae]